MLKILSKLARSSAALTLPRQLESTTFLTSSACSFQQQQHAERTAIEAFHPAEVEHELAHGVGSKRRVARLAERPQSVIFKPSCEDEHRPAVLKLHADLHYCPRDYCLGD